MIVCLLARVASSKMSTTPKAVTVAGNAPRFTANEIKVLKALHASFEGNGFDFGFVDEATDVEGLSRKSAGAVLRELHKKVRIFTNEPVTTDSGTFTQITANIADDGVGYESLKNFHVWLRLIDKKALAPRKMTYDEIEKQHKELVVFVRAQHTLACLPPHILAIVEPFRY